MAFLWEFAVRDIPASMIIDSVDAGVGAFIDLFEADLQPFGGDLIRFHSGTNGYYGNVIWKGNQYQAYPIAVEGFESKNEAPTPARLWRWRTLPVY